jgi:hypothetical protein
MTQQGPGQLCSLLVRLLSLIILLAGVVLSCPARSARAAAGDLDLTFDSDGRRTFLSSTTEDRALAVAVRRTDGKIVVVGDTDFFGTSDALVMRFNASGSADSTFDNDGRRIYDEPGAEDHGQAVAVANDKIVVAGYSNFFGTNE